MAIEIQMKKEEYFTFMNVMRALKNSCKDVSIVDGEIIQMDDKKSIAYSLNMTDIVGFNTIYINDLFNKYDLLDTFLKQACDVNLKIEDTKYTFSDNYSDLKFSKPDPEYLINKPMKKTNNYFNQYITVSEEELVFETIMSKTILERLFTCFKVFKESNTVSIMFKNGDANIISHAKMNKSISSMTVMKIENVDIINTDGIIDFPKDLFTVGGTNLIVKLYRNKFNTKMLTIKCEVSLGINPSVNMCMWSTNIFKQSEK